MLNGADVLGNLGLAGLALFIIGLVTWFLELMVFSSHFLSRLSSGLAFIGLLIFGLALWMGESEWFYRKVKG